jgi:hypothetical protein
VATATQDRADDAQIASIIRTAADEARLSRRVALAFAWCESKHNPRAAGDLKWAEREGGLLYTKHVLKQARLDHNPDRLRPEVWHSYGLFQLLACYHVGDTESPIRLYEPGLNAKRGCAAIARLLVRSKGDVRSARLAYVGCGYEGGRCSPEVVKDVSGHLLHALERFEGEAT